MRIRSFLCGLVAIAVVAGSAVQAKASFVYDNGPINGTITAHSINYGWQVSDSFSFSNPSVTNLTDAQVGLWVLPGDTPTGVQWSIGTSALGR
jgi:hypothetical protein